MMTEGRFPSKTFTLMVTVTGALVVMLAVLMSGVLAQISIGDSTNLCPDKCDGDTLYLKGVWDLKLRQCVYVYQEVCEYGCDSRLSCNEFPEEPPVDVSEYDETLWKMQRRVYDSVSIDISTGATEYTLGDNATIFAKVTDLGSAVNDGFCDALIFAPNQTQIAGFSLYYVNNSRGIYSYEYPVPDDYGVYMVDVECFMPYNASNESRYFRTVSTVNKLLNTTTTATNSTETLYELSLGFQCLGDRFTESILDKNNGNISDYRFLQNITDTIAWFNDDTGAATDYEIRLNFYKVTDKGSLLMGSTDDIVTIASATVPVYFNDTGIEMPFDSTSLVQVEVCARRVSGANPTDLTFYYNSQYYNSSFMIHTLDYDDPLDFVVGGSSEVHVSDVPYETYLTFATLPEPVLLSNHDYCLDNQTLGKTLTWEQCLSGRCDNYSRNESIVCPYGCYGNITAGACNPAPFDRNLFLMGIFIFVVIVIILLAFAYDRFTR